MKYKKFIEGLKEYFESAKEPTNHEYSIDDNEIRLSWLSDYDMTLSLRINIKNKNYFWWYEDPDDEESTVSHDITTDERILTRINSLFPFEEKQTSWDRVFDEILFKIA